MERTCKPNSVSLAGRESFICRSHCCGGRATYPNARTDTGESIASLFGLAPQGVCRAVDTRVRRGALLPHRFTLTTLALRLGFGGLFSVALSVASPRLAVSQPAARRSSDFPRSRFRGTAILRSAPRREDNSPCGQIFLRLNCCCLNYLERMSARRHQNFSRFVGSEK